MRVHPAQRLARNRFERQLQNTADPPVRIVGLFAGENFLPRLQLTRHPQSLEIRHRSAAAQVAKKILPTVHASDLCDRFFFHHRRGPPAIQRVIIRIDPHGQRIRQPGLPGAAASASVPRTTDENRDSYLAAARRSPRALPQGVPSPAIDFEKQADLRIRYRAFWLLP